MNTKEKQQKSIVLPAKMLEQIEKVAQKELPDVVRTFPAILRKFIREALERRGLKADD